MVLMVLKCLESSVIATQVDMLITVLILAFGDLASVVVQKRLAFPLVHIFPTRNGQKIGVSRHPSFFAG